MDTNDRFLDIEENVEMLTDRRTDQSRLKIAVCYYQSILKFAVLLTVKT